MEQPRKTICAVPISPCANLSIRRKFSGIFCKKSGDSLISRIRSYESPKRFWIISIRSFHFLFNHRENKKNNIAPIKTICLKEPVKVQGIKKNKIVVIITTTKANKEYMILLLFPLLLISGIKNDNIQESLTPDMFL